MIDAVALVAAVYFCAFVAWLAEADLLSAIAPPDASLLPASVARVATPALVFQATALAGALLAGAVLVVERLQSSACFAALWALYAATRSFGGQFGARREASENERLRTGVFAQFQWDLLLLETGALVVLVRTMSMSVAVRW